MLPLVGWAIDGNFLLKGKISKGTAKAKIYLNYKLNGKMKTISAPCPNGIFEFKGTIPEPKLARLIMDYKGIGLEALGEEADALVFFLEPGNITVATTSTLKNAVVTGSKLNEENKKFMVLLKPINASMNAIVTDFYSAPETKQQSAEFKNEMDAKLKDVGVKRRAVLNEYVKSHPSSFISLQTLMEAFEENVDVKKIKALFNTLSPQLRNSPSGKVLNSKL
ncbi:protein of unknown function [Pedobacter steynii]|uniref:DUF4369 domain-containing protein n=2 Tax=Pedobacter steynii TaxID=430522 RepID=A0A1G9K2K0_9SPHI|nr:protein of unknown function [Pedobacter steynii]